MILGFSTSILLIFSFGISVLCRQVPSREKRSADESTECKVCKPIYDTSCTGYNRTFPWCDKASDIASSYFIARNPFFEHVQCYLDFNCPFLTLSSVDTYGKKFSYELDQFNSAYCNETGLNAGKWFYGMEFAENVPLKSFKCMEDKPPKLPDAVEPCRRCKSVYNTTCTGKVDGEPWCVPESEVSIEYSQGNKFSCQMQLECPPGTHMESSVDGVAIPGSSWDNSGYCSEAGDDEGQWYLNPNDRYSYDPIPMSSVKCVETPEDAALPCTACRKLYDTSCTGYADGEAWCETEESVAPTYTVGSIFTDDSMENSQDGVCTIAFQCPYGQRIEIDGEGATASSDPFADHAGFCLQTGDNAGQWFYGSYANSMESPLNSVRCVESQTEPETGPIGLTGCSNSDETGQCLEPAAPCTRCLKVYNTTCSGPSYGEPWCASETSMYIRYDSGWVLNENGWTYIDDGPCTFAFSCPYETEGEVNVYGETGYTSSDSYYEGYCEETGDNAGQWYFGKYGDESSSPMPMQNVKCVGKEQPETPDVCIDYEKTGLSYEPAYPCSRCFKIYNTSCTGNVDGQPWCADEASVNINYEIGLVYTDQTFHYYDEGACLLSLTCPSDTNVEVNAYGREVPSDLYESNIAYCSETGENAGQWYYGQPGVALSDPVPMKSLKCAGTMEPEDSCVQTTPVQDPIIEPAYPCNVCGKIYDDTCTGEDPYQESWCSSACDVGINYKLGEYYGNGNANTCFVEFTCPMTTMLEYNMKNADSQIPLQSELMAYCAEDGPDAGIWRYGRTSSESSDDDIQSLACRGSY